MRPTSYEVRLFIPIRFRRVLPWAELAPIYSGSRTGTIVAHMAASSMQGFTWSLTYKEGDFTDSWELKGELLDFQIRYSREAQAGLFPAFGPFLVAANLPRAIEYLRPVIEPLIADPERLRGRTFLDPAQR
jgi:hypothetical protein